MLAAVRRRISRRLPRETDTLKHPDANIPRFREARTDDTIDDQREIAAD